MLLCTEPSQCVWCTGTQGAQRHLGSPEARIRGACELPNESTLNQIQVLSNCNICSYWFYNLHFYTCICLCKYVLCVCGCPLRPAFLAIENWVLETELSSSGRAAMASNFWPSLLKLLTIGLDSEYTKWPKLGCFHRIHRPDLQHTLIRCGMCRQTKWRAEHD